jgi:vesicular inhibitory amino acid transporter
MDWADEQLPANAYRRRSSGPTGSSTALGRRERRREARIPEERHRAMDRRVTRLSVDDQGDEERSRSRSRSPKRINAVRPTSGLRIRSSQSSQESEDSSNGGPSSNSQRLKRGSTSNQNADENTPLLNPSDVESRRPEERVLRTPSWFKSPGTSGTTAKYRVQGYGTSTFWQSWFNTVNALIGVGIL